MLIRNLIPLLLITFLCTRGRAQVSVVGPESHSFPGIVNQVHTYVRWVEDTDRRMEGKNYTFGLDAWYHRGTLRRIRWRADEEQTYHLILDSRSLPVLLCSEQPTNSNRAYFERLKSGNFRTFCVFISTGHGEALYPAFYGFRIFAKEWENIAYEMIGKVKSFDPR